MTEQSELLFVYGTLMKDTHHPMAKLLAEHSEFICRATLQAQLYLIDYYPGAILSNNEHDIVYGDLYKLSSTGWLLNQLDGYEECSSAFPEPHEYQRQQVTVQTINSTLKISTAWAYLYQYPVENKQRISDGQFNMHFSDGK